MKKIIFLLTLILSTSFLYASFFDTGYVQWKQPNDVEFTARLWGDEFESQMETSDGYRVKIGVDNYYYYAELDTSGDYEPSPGHGRRP